MTMAISILGVLKIIANGVGSIVTTKHATFFCLILMSRTSLESHLEVNLVLP